MLFPNHIDDVLQAVHNCQWFKSSDLAQDYLQMPVEEADILKTAFRAGSTGLYEFTHMPFGLSQLWVQFLSPHGMRLRDQQFVTLLLYLDNICVFAASIDEMLDCIELVFKWLEKFNLKMKPKKCHFFQCSIVFLGHVLSAEGISENPKKVEKVKYWPVPINPKEIQLFLRLASYYCHIILRFSAIAKCLHQLVGPANHQKARKTGRIMNQRQNQVKIDKLFNGQANIKKYSTF